MIYHPSIFNRTILSIQHNTGLHSVSLEVSILLHQIVTLKRSGAADDGVTVARIKWDRADASL